jgi:ERCC4-type nuclease
VLLLDKNDREILLFERKSLADLLASIKDGRYEEQSYRLIHSSGLCPHHIVYVIEGMISQLRGPKEKKIVYSAMTSLGVFKGYSVLRTSSVQETAELLLALADKVGRDMAKGKVPWTPTVREQYNVEHVNVVVTDDQGIMNNSVNEPINEPMNEHVVQPLPAAYCTVVKKIKKDNITPANMGEIVLCQVPGVSSVSAIAIMSKFRSIAHLIQELSQNPTCLDGIMCVSKDKSRKLSKTIIKNIKTFLLYSGPESIHPGESSESVDHVVTDEVETNI